MQQNAFLWKVGISPWFHHLGDPVNFLGQGVSPWQRFGGHPKLSFSCTILYFLICAVLKLDPTGTIIIPQTSWAPIKSVSQATPNGLDGYFSNFSSLHREDGYCVLGFSKFCTKQCFPFWPAVIHLYLSGGVFGVFAPGPRAEASLVGSPNCHFEFPPLCYCLPSSHNTGTSSPISEHLLYYWLSELTT